MADPTLTRTAVEEIVRWASPVTWMRRTATQDGELNGHRVPRRRQGPARSTPRPTATPRSSPTRTCFDLGRDPNPHVGFGGHGPHFCLGAHLARREIAVTFRALFDRLPDLEVTGEPDRLRSSFVNGIKRLPARLTGAAVTRVEVDRDRCVGSGTCEVLAPTVFEVDDDGVLAVLAPEPGDGRPADVRDAVEACPTRALALAD